MVGHSIAPHMENGHVVLRCVLIDHGYKFVVALRGAIAVGSALKPTR